MVAEISVRGAEKLHVLSRALRDAGDRDLSRDMYRGLNRAQRRLKQDVVASIPRYMPTRYALLLRRDVKVVSRRRAGGHNPAIYLLATAKQRDIGSLNRGRLRHPLYGNRGRWFDTRIDPLWWDEPLFRDAPKVRVELERVLDDIADKVVRRVRR
jgi:hypothetical protein